MLQHSKKNFFLNAGEGVHKATPFPPPFIVGGAGVTQAAATGAYKDLCAGTGIRLHRARTLGECGGGGEGGGALARFARLRVWAVCPGRRVRPARGPRDPGWLGRFARSRKARIGASSWHRHTQDLPLVPQFPTETTEWRREALSLIAIAA